MFEHRAATVLRTLDGHRGWVGPASALSGRTAKPATRSAAPGRRVIQVPDQLAGLLPEGGLRAGSVVAVRGSTSLLYALLGTASAGGAWSAVVGRPDLGLLAAAEAGVALDRLALVPSPGAQLAVVVGALLDGVDLVAVAGTRRLTEAQARRLAGRARQRGAVLLPLDDWPGADVVLTCTRIEWSGPDAGHGRLLAMRATVLVTGRGAAARRRQTSVQLIGGQPGGARLDVVPARAVAAAG